MRAKIAFILVSQPAFRGGLTSIACSSISMPHCSPERRGAARTRRGVSPVPYLVS
jgi:hypothetical protein